MRLRPTAVLTLVVTLCCLLSDTALLLRAQERETRTRISVLFPINRYVLLRDYADNASALDALDRQLQEDNPAGINLVVIISAASPEGPTTFNEMLSQRCAATFWPSAPTLRTRSNSAAWVKPGWSCIS